MTETECLLILNAIPGLTNARIRKLIDAFGCGRDVLSLSEHNPIAQKNLPAEIIQNILRFERDSFLKNELSQIKRNNISIILDNDINYPEQLKEIPDAPVVLYVKGHLQKANKLALAIVGSRRASVYGLQMAEKFAVELSELGFTIVSGMARGIDAAAHRGCLKANGKTIAVLGSGLASIYPPENKKLFQEIAEKGAVISEFPMQALPLAYHFPRRNRIVSGLSLGVVVVEASRKSGALITSDLALEQGREVFAVPGKIDHPNSQGVHNLIKQGAKLASCVEDIIEELRPQLEAVLREDKQVARKKDKKIRTSSLSEPEKKILRFLSDRPVHIDELVEQCGSDIPVTVALLLHLELKRLVQQLPGKIFVKN